MKRAHIITCLSYEDYSTFIAEGYAGLYPIKADEITQRKLASKITTNWDIIADLKRVKPDDYIFLHVRNDKIYGPFIATTYFLESLQMPAVFKSANLHIDYWTEHYVHTDFDFNPFPWRVGIKSVEGITREGGFNSMELFKLKSTGLIQSVPDRFLYHDKPKIVKPLLTHETETMLKILDSIPSPFLTVNNNGFEEFDKIRLHLRSYNGELFREKILEAWLMENITLNGDNRLQFENIKSIFGETHHFVNSIFTYYANFLDVLLYSEGGTLVDEYCNECCRYTSKNKANICVIELKKGRVDASAIYQVKEYGDWVLKSIANNDRSRVKLFVIGASFREEALGNDDVTCVKYSIIDDAPFLNLEIVRPGDII